jgi:hypothetical protein
VVDSSGWIEFFTDGPQADDFAPAIEASSQLIVPSLSLLEVFQWVLREHGESAAIQATALMQRGQVAELSAQLALEAAQLGLAHRLPMADSVILATARRHKARLLTLDSDFADLSDVVWIRKQTNG